MASLLRISLLLAARIAAFSCMALPGTAQALERPASTPPPQAATPASTHALAQTLAQLPLAFEENHGQVDAKVQFLAAGQAGRLFLTPAEAVMVLDETATVLRMRFEGANPKAPAKGVEPLGHTTNYLRGADPKQHITDLPNHARVRYTAIYPGIDLEYYGNQGKLEYDLILAPGAQPQQVRLRFPGTAKVSLAPDGALALATAAGEVRYRPPVAYQTLDGHRTEVAARYKLRRDGQVGFALGAYDRSQPLVIDPVLEHSSFLWGMSAKGMALDAAGNIYVAGQTSTSDVPAATGYLTKLSGTIDAYVAKLDPSGTRLLWATYLGARRTQTQLNALAVDAAGSAYVSGQTNTASYPVTSGAYKTTFSLGNSYITKLSPNGNALVYSTFAEWDTTVALQADSAGNLYIGGNCAGIATTPGVFQPAILPGGGRTPFVAKLNPVGSAMVYATLLGGSNSDEARGLAVDAAGNAYLAGKARSANFPLLTPYQSTLRGASDGFVAKLNPTGTALVYSTLLGGAADDYANAVAVAPDGHAYVAGWTNSDNFPTTPGVFQPLKGYPGTQISNAFIAKIGLDGSTLGYASYLGGKWCLQPGVSSCLTLGGDGVDAATAVAVDAAGYAYVGGYATSAGFPQVDQIQAITQGGDANRTPFVAKVRPDGAKLVYSVVLGTRWNDETVTAMAQDGKGGVVVAGLYSPGSVDFPVTPGAHATSGISLLFKLSPGKYPTTLRTSLNPASAGQNVTLTADVQGIQPGGSVTFMADGVSLGTVPVEGGAAVLTTGLAVGIHKITAVFSGDGVVSPPLFQLMKN